MNINTYVSGRELRPGELNGTTAVVVDVLRTSTVIITAIESGCDRIVPVASAEEAVRTLRSVEGDSVLGGEIGISKIPDFHLGNSPSEYIQQAVKGKILLYTTTNGTRAIRATFNAAFSCVASLQNTDAIADMLVQRGEDIKIICAGNDGAMAIEDFFGAGAIVERIIEKRPDANLVDDCTLLTLKLYREYKGRLHELLEGSAHYEHLKSSEYSHDIEACFRENTSNIVPIYKEGVITK